MSLIPKNIYKTAPFLHPKLNKLYLNTELENPGWKIKFYNDKDCITFLENEFSNDNLDLKKKVLTSYNKLIPSAYKADLWRLCVIYEYGGVYSDASQIFKMPLDKIIDTTKEFCIIKDRPGIEQGGGAKANLNGLQIALFSSVKKHPDLLKYIENINMNVHKLAYGQSTLHVTGPHLAYEVANKYNFLDKIKIIGCQSSNIGYTNNDGIVIVQKATFHRNIVYGDSLQYKHYDKLWRERKIFNISDENKKNKSEQKKKNPVLPRLVKKRPIIKNKIRKNNLYHNKNNKNNKNNNLSGFDSSRNIFFRGMRM